MNLDNFHKRTRANLLPPSHPLNRRSTVAVEAKGRDWRKGSVLSEAGPEAYPDYTPLLRYKDAGGLPVERSPLQALEGNKRPPAGRTTALKDFLFTLNAVPRCDSLRQSHTMRSSAMQTQQEPGDAALRSMLEVRLRTEYELIDLKNDGWPLLPLRQAILRQVLFARRLCRAVSSNWVFETSIIVLIVANTIVLSQEDMSLSQQPDPFATLERTFLYIYTAELSIRIAGVGLISGKNAFVKDYWNLMDLAVVATGWVEDRYSRSSVNLSVLRTFRILRPLRSITRIEGMRIIFLSLLGSIRLLLSTIALLLFFLLVSSIAALQTFNGALRYRCMHLDTGWVSTDDSELCGSRRCSPGYECVKADFNPVHGVEHFDNLISAGITVFKSVTMEGWTVVLDHLQKTLGVAVAVFFTPLVFIGAFFFLNLTIVAMKASVKVMQFSRAMDEVRQRQHLKKQYEEEVLTDDVITVAKRMLDTVDEASRDSPITFRKTLSGAGTGQFALVQAGGSEVRMKESELAVARAERPLDASDCSADALLHSEDISPQSSWLSPFSVHSSPTVSVSSSLAQLDLCLYTSDLSVSQWNHGNSIIAESPQLSQSSDTPQTQRNSVLYRVKIPPTERQLFDSSDLSQGNAISNHQKNVVVAVMDTYALDLRSVEDIMEGVSEKTDTVSAKPSKDQAKVLRRWKRSKTARGFEAFVSLCLRLSDFESFRKLVPDCYESEEVRFSQRKMRESDTRPWSGADVSVSRSAQSTLEGSNLPYRLWSKGARGSMERISYVLALVCGNALFNYFMTVCIVVNTAVLSVNHYGIDSDILYLCDRINLGFTGIFLLEMLIKLGGLRIRGYFREKMNIFDAAIVTLSIIELSFFSGTRINALRVLRLFRIIRVLRVARLLRYMSYMRKVMAAISQSMEEFVYLGALIFLLLYVFSLLGMGLFAGKFGWEDANRESYDGFNFSFLSTFQVLTSENWTNVLHNGMRALGTPASLYFIAWLFLGNFVMLNLLLAILLDVFTTISDDDEFIQSQLSKNLTLLHTVEGSSRRMRKRLETIKQKIKDIERESVDSGSDSLDHTVKQPLPLFVDITCEASFCVLTKRSTLRIFCYRICSSVRFEWTVMIAIALSSMTLIWETYLLKEPSDSVYIAVVKGLDTFFCLLFAAELMVKCVAMGVVLEPKTYLRDSWNLLDAIIVLFSLFDTFFSGTNLSILKVFRLLRAVRPLRFISHNASMRIIVSALFESFRALLNVVAVVLVTWLIFAILGVSLFAGKMATCSGDGVGTKMECEYYGGQWVTAPYHFDNVLEAMVTLFQLTSPENWNDTMYSAMDTRGVDLSMKKNANRYAGYYFVIFLVVSNFFFLNLFLGVVFDKFEKSKRENTSISELLLQRDQYRWVEMMKYVACTKHTPEVPIVRSGVRLFLYSLVTHCAFDAFLMVCIVCNLVVMSLLYADAPTAYVSALEYLGVIFTAIFAVEAGVKIIAFGAAGYFKKGWNRFDFTVMVSSVLELGLSALLTSLNHDRSLFTVGAPLLRTLRVLRVARLFRLVKRVKLITDLVGMISVSLYAIGNVMTLLVLIFVVYGVLGVFLFSGVKHGSVIDDLNNFSNFGMAELLLLRISTGEDWNYILTDCAKAVNPWLSHTFFFSFVSITTFIMYNLFVMVMLQEYETYQANPLSSYKLFKEELRVFNLVWNKTSPSAYKSRMDVGSLVTFAQEMGSHIGVKPGMSRYDILKLLRFMGLRPDNQGFVYYHEALFRLMRLKFGVQNRINSKVRKKVLEREEGFYLRKVKQLKKADQMQSAPEILKVTFSNPNDMSFAFLKSVFRSWREWTKTHKSASDLSETPRSDVYPGSNSLRDIDSPSPPLEPEKPRIHLSSRTSSWLSKIRTDD